MTRRTTTEGSRGGGKHRAARTRASTRRPGAPTGPKAKRAPSGGSPVDPRLDQRRRDVARSRRRKWWIGFGSLAGTVLAVLVGWALLHSSLFSVHALNVTGASNLVHDEVVAASGVTKGSPLISIDAAAAATSVEAIPLIKTAEVQLRWPTTVTIAVTMRTPVGFIASAGRFVRVDRTGRVLSVSVNPPTRFSPVPLEMQIAGVTPGKPGSWLPDRAAGAVKVATKVPPAFRGQVAKVTGNAVGTVTLQMTAPVTINLGTADKLHAKFSDVAAIIAGTSLHAGDVIDVSVPQASTITRAAN